MTPADRLRAELASSPSYVSSAELEAAFLAARAYGKILGDDVLRAIILAARTAAHPAPS